MEEAQVEELTEREFADATAPEETEEERLERLKRDSRKPPAEGPCKGCGQNRPLNRLMLCYRCWVNKNILDWAKANNVDWIPGDPHPAWCRCEGLGGHGTAGGN